MECFVEFMDFGFELNVAKVLLVVFCFEVAGTPLELVEGGAEGLVAGGVRDASELPAEAVPKQCDLFG